MFHIQGDADIAASIEGSVQLKIMTTITRHCGQNPRRIEQTGG